MPETTPAGTPARGETPRGFAVYDEFTDKYGNKVRVQKSSLATDDCVWVFGVNTEDGTGSSPHLTVGMAGRLRAALGEFIREHAEAGAVDAAEAEDLAAAIHEDLHDGCGLGPAELHRAAAAAALRWMKARGVPGA